jgi:hypothetical protein
MKFSLLMLMTFVTIDLAHSRKPSYECEAHTVCGSVAGSEGCGFSQDRQTTYTITRTTYDSEGNGHETELGHFNSPDGCKGCAKLLKSNPGAKCRNFR